MYFLTHYDELIDAYKKDGDLHGYATDGEKEIFISEMNSLKTLLETLNGNALVTDADLRELAMQYNHIFQKYGEKFRMGALSKEHKAELMHELNTITYMDTSENKNLEELFALAEVPDDVEDLRSSLLTPNVRYMADSALIERGVTDRSNDLSQDRDFLLTLDGELANSKKFVFGSSPFFDNMERSFLGLKDLARTLARGELTDDAITQYKQKLTELLNNARAYESYKTNNGSKALNTLKAKEQRRVTFSQELQRFAESRIHKIDLALAKQTLFNDMNRHEKEYDANLRQKINANSFDYAYELRMRNAASDMHEFDLCFTEQNELSPKAIIKTHVRGNYEHNLCQLLKDTFGGLNESKEIIALRDEFLNKPKCGRLISKGVLEDADTARTDRPQAYKEARGKAVHTLLAKLSNAKYVTGNYAYIASLTDLLARDSEPDPQTNTDLNEPLSAADMAAVKGANIIGGIVSEGIGAWEVLHSTNDINNNSHFIEKMRNFVTMKVLESEMKMFSSKQDSQGRINPIFEKFGTNPQSAEILKEKISSSKEFKEMLKMSPEELHDLTRKETAKTSQFFSKLAVNVLTQTIKTLDEAAKQNASGSKMIENEHQIGDQKLSTTEKISSYFKESADIKDSARSKDTLNLNDSPRLSDPVHQM